MNKRKPILLTTPDFPPNRLGGLATFAKQLSDCLIGLQIEHEVFNWKNINEARGKDYKNYDEIINVHFLPTLFYRNIPTINFIHGSEIIPHSPNFFKKIYKRFFYSKIIESISNAKFNIFISEFTQKLYQSYGGQISFDRDMVFHNCININGQELEKKSLDSQLKLCAFVRNVPHKNIQGIIELFNVFRKLHPSGAELYIPYSANDKNIHNVTNCSDAEREEIYKISHLNLLLSLDHIHRGNIEGFGLTVLEAGKYGVPTIGSSHGGIPESVHNHKTGVILNSMSISEIENAYSFIMRDYQTLQKNCYQHTHQNHSMQNFERLLGAIL